MEQVVTNLQQQLGAQQQALQQMQAVMDAQQASAAQRENALQAQLADLSDRLNLNMGDTQTQSVHRVSSILEVGDFLTPMQLHGGTGHSSSRTWLQQLSRRRESLLNGLDG